MYNKFVVPDYKNEDNFIDLMRTLYNCIGIKTGKYKKLAKYIPKNNHYLFILCDGMGSNIVDQLKENSILKKNKVKDLVTIFPSTTGCVLSSLATGSFPSDHGIWGWFNYNKEKKLNYYPVLFSRREDRVNLKSINIKRKDVFKNTSLLKSKSDYKINILFSKSIVDSEYSKFVGYNKNRYAYETDLDIINFIKKDTLNNKKSFTYLYLSDIDKLEHANGIDSDLVFNRISEIDNLVKELSKIKDLTIVITADHGQVNVSKKVVFNYSKYEKYFYAKPSIDCGTMSYYVKDEYFDKFNEEFSNDYHECVLFKTKDLEDKGYFNNKLSKYAKDSIGNFISVCKEDYYMISSDLIEKDEVLKGNHSGLLKGEMIIPLIVIGK